MNNLQRHLQQQQLVQVCPEHIHIKSNNTANAIFKNAKAPNTNLTINSLYNMPFPIYHR